jgi:hypothetical protein
VIVPGRDNDAESQGSVCRVAHSDFFSQLLARSSARRSLAVRLP